MGPFDQEHRVLRDALLATLAGDRQVPELDIHLVEFDDVRYHLQANEAETRQILLSVRLPPAPAECPLESELPQGALDEVRRTFGSVADIEEPAEAGFHLTLRVNMTNLSLQKGESEALAAQLATLRSVVIGAPLRCVLRCLAEGRLDDVGSKGSVIPILHRAGECFYAFPQGEQVTVTYPMRFREPNDVVLATSFLQEFMEARRHGSLSATPPCSYSFSPPLELLGTREQPLEANAGFVSFVLFPRHVEGPKLEKTAWILCTFHAYVRYHVKCSKAFMHTHMRRRVDSLIQMLNAARPEAEREKKTAQGRFFKRDTALS